MNKNTYLTTFFYEKSVFYNILFPSLHTINYTAIICTNVRTNSMERRLCLGTYYSCILLLYLVNI